MTESEKIAAVVTATRFLSSAIADLQGRMYELECNAHELGVRMVHIERKLNNMEGDGR